IHSGNPCCGTHRGTKCAETTTACNGSDAWRDQTTSHSTNTTEHRCTRCTENQSSCRMQWRTVRGTWLHPHRITERDRVAVVEPVDIHSAGHAQRILLDPRPRPRIIRPVPELLHTAPIGAGLPPPLRIRLRPARESCP